MWPWPCLSWGGGEGLGREGKCLSQRWLVHTDAFTAMTHSSSSRIITLYSQCEQTVSNQQIQHNSPDYRSAAAAAKMMLQQSSTDTLQCIVCYGVIASLKKTIIIKHTIFLIFHGILVLSQHNSGMQTLQSYDSPVWDSKPWCSSKNTMMCSECW